MSNLTCRCINQSILACLFCCFGQQSSVGARYRPLQALNWTNRSEWLLVLLVLSWRLANNLLMVHCRHHPIWSASSNVAQQQPTSIQDIHPFSNPLYTLKDRGGCWSISQLSSSFYFVSKNGQKKTSALDIFMQNWFINVRIHKIFRHIFKEILLQYFLLQKMKYVENIWSKQSICLSSPLWQFGILKHIDHWT